MSPLWTSEEAARAVSGTLHGSAWQASGVSIDTRTLKPGDLFIALSAARDGHEFVADALQKGAAAALVSHIPEGLEEGAPLLQVSNVQAGLEALGIAGRARFGGHVVAITGSVGKTTTKEMLRLILGRQGQVSAAEASYNNHWGVPLTLARLPRDADYAVIEIGMNHPGEIEPLARMASPHSAVITAIAPAHIEAFGTLDGIAAEKASIYRGLVHDGTAIYPRDCAERKILKHAAKEMNARRIAFGQSAKKGFIIDDIRLSDAATTVSVQSPKGALTFKLNVVGRHYASNAVAALAGAYAVGADLSVAAMDMADWRPFEGRGQREHIRLDPTEQVSFELIDDAFNANPASIAAGLEVLAAAKPKGGKRVAILGDMLELGESELADHAAIAELASIEKIGLIHCVGPRMRALWEALPGAKRGEWAESADDMRSRTRHLIKPGDVVLVKGSKGSRVSIIASALRGMAHPQAIEET